MNYCWSATGWPIGHLVLISRYVGWLPQCYLLVFPQVTNVCVNKSGPVRLNYWQLFSISVKSTFLDGCFKWPMNFSVKGIYGYTRLGQIQYTAVMKAKINTSSAELLQTNHVWPLLIALKQKQVYARNWIHVLFEYARHSQIYVLDLKPYIKCLAS